MNKTLLFLFVHFLLVYASPKPGQTLSEYLWEETEEYQKEALNSNLIHGIREECLDPSQFGGYMVDDSVYSYESMISLTIAADRADRNKTLQNFLRSEAELWRESLEWLHKVWHIKDTRGITVGEAAGKYMSHIRRVADKEDPAYTILALIPGVKLWPWLGQQIGSGSRDFGVYTSWVEESFDPNTLDYLEYQNHVEWAYEHGKIRADKALEIFSTSMENEVKFFNSVARCQTRRGNNVSEHIIVVNYFELTQDQAYDNQNL